MTHEGGIVNTCNAHFICGKFDTNVQIAEASKSKLKPATFAKETASSMRNLIAACDKPYSG